MGVGEWNNGMHRSKVDGSNKKSLQICDIQLVRFRPTSSGAECRTEAGAREALYVDCTSGVVEEKICTGGAVEVRRGQWLRRRVHWREGERILSCLEL